MLDRLADADPPRIGVRGLRQLGGFQSFPVETHAARETAPISEEERSALWLYAWHCVAHPPAHASWADRLLPDRFQAVERRWAAS